MIPVNNSCINKRSNNFRNTYLRNIVEEILPIYIFQSFKKLGGRRKEEQNLYCIKKYKNFYSIELPVVYVFRIRCIDGSLLKNI